ncbi:MAG: hypothetical protein M1834_004403 [Cirrosporium novae-zelandiae]|nr:MAG: hypothetical protein M1834_004403 [Cirrosporium novae-zelandiae]
MAEVIKTALRLRRHQPVLVQRDDKIMNSDNNVHNIQKVKGDGSQTSLFTIRPISILSTGSAGDAHQVSISPHSATTVTIRYDAFRLRVVNPDPDSPHPRTSTSSRYDELLFGHGRDSTTRSSEVQASFPNQDSEAEMKCSMVSRQLLQPSGETSFLKNLTFKNSPFPHLYLDGSISSTSKLSSPHDESTLIKVPPLKQRPTRSLSPKRGRIATYSAGKFPKVRSKKVCSLIERRDILPTPRRIITVVSRTKQVQRALRDASRLPTLNGNNSIRSYYPYRLLDPPSRYYKPYKRPVPQRSEPRKVLKRTHTPEIPACLRVGFAGPLSTQRLQPALSNSRSQEPIPAPLRVGQGSQNSESTIKPSLNLMELFGESDKFQEEAPSSWLSRPSPQGYYCKWGRKRTYFQHATKEELLQRQNPNFPVPKLEFPADLLNSIVDEFWKEVDALVEQTEDALDAYWEELFSNTDIDSDGSTDACNGFSDDNWDNLGVDMSPPTDALDDINTNKTKMQSEPPRLELPEDILEPFSSFFRQHC